MENKVINAVLLFSDVILNKKVKYSDVLSLSRKKDIVYCRKLISKILFDRGIKTKEIGWLINRDHSTVVISKQRMEDEIALYPEVKRDVRLINWVINNG